MRYDNGNTFYLGYPLGDLISWVEGENSDGQRVQTESVLLTFAHIYRSSPQGTIDRYEAGEGLGSIVPIESIKENNRRYPNSILDEIHRLPGLVDIVWLDRSPTGRMVTENRSHGIYPVL